ncbi:coiled-coil domain-containing protein mad1, partial [Coemansia sp. RSA 2704]
MQAAGGRRGGETPAGRAQAGQLPASTVIRTRFRDMSERAPATARGTKRYMVDGSPDGAAWLETPIRGGQARAPLVDTQQRPQRLFTHESPARAQLDSAQRGSELAGRMEALRRDCERAKFEARQVELARARDREEAAQERQQLEARLLAQTQRVERLERDRAWLAEQDARLAEQRRAVDAQLDAQRRAHAAQLDEAAATEHALRERLDAAARVLRETRAEHVAQLERQRAGALQHAQDAALQHTVDAQRRELAAKDQEIAELQQRLRAQDGGGECDTATRPHQRVAQLERDLREQCARAATAEKQSAVAQEQSAAAEKLSAAAEKQCAEAREAAAALEAKAARLEAQLRERAHDGAELEALRQERAQWQRVFADDAGGSPLAVARAVAAQRQAAAQLNTRVAELEAAADAHAAQLREHAATAAQATRRAEQLTQDLADAQLAAARVESARQHAVREAAFLREQLHSYDAEEAALCGNYDRQKATRIAQLESFIDEQRAWLAAPDKEGAAEKEGAAVREGAAAALLQSYREDAEQKQRDLQSCREDAEQKQRALDAARAEHERLSARFDALEKEAARLEHQVGAGLGYDPRTTRILQLVDNPAARDYAIRSDKLRALAAENAALLERIRLLEQPSTLGQSSAPEQPSDGAAPEASPYFHTIDNLRAENLTLARQLDDSAKLISRLKREWKRKAAELREVVYAVLGYRVDFLANGSVRFTSTYAAHVDQSLVFTSADADQAVMRLLGGGSKSYVQGLANDIRYWVQERGSIPGFMATVTLQNFEAQ